MKNSAVIIAAAALIIGAAGGFFGGVKYQQSQRPTFGQFGNSGANGARVGRLAGGGQNGFRPVAGQVLSVGGGTMTVKMTDGSSKIVLFSDSTTITKTSPGTKADLTAGTTVAAFGTANADGSVTAGTIQINPERRGGSVPAGQPAQ